MANGNGAKTKRQLAKETESLPLRKWSPAVLEAERERVEKVWAETEPDTTTILNSLNELVVVQDLEHRVLWANSIAGESVGLPSKKLMGRYCYDVWGWGGRTCPGCPVAKARKTGKPQAGEMTTPDGRVWLVKGYPIRNARGDITGLVELALEITERKQAEDKLQAEKNKLQSVIGAMEDGLTIQDKDFNIIYQNEPLGKNYGGHIGEKCYRVYEGRDEVCDGCPVKKAFNDGKSHTAQRRVVLPSGEEAFGENTASPIRDAEGKVTFCLEIIRDITERKQAEKELHESEERFRSIVGNSQVGILILDDAYHILYVNDEQCRISGYSRDEAVGQDFRKFLDEGTQRVLSGLYRRGQKGEEIPPHYEFSFTAKDGQKRRVEVNSSVIRNSAGEIRTVAQLLDITERKRVEEELQAEKNKLQSLIGAMEFTLTIQDKDFNIIYQNEAAKLSSAGDHVGEKCYRVYEHRDTVCDGCPVAKSFKDGKSHTTERQNIGSSGEVVFWENTANPVRDVKGKIVSCLEIGVDITERKKAEEALAGELTRRRILIDQSRDGIVILDQNGKVYEANQKFAEMLGYTPEEVRKLCVWDWEFLFPREQVAEMVASVGPEGDHFETKHRRKDGSTFDVEISTNGAVYAGQKLIFCVCRDITERKQAEKALAEAEAKYKTLVEATSDLIWEADGKGVYTFVSPNIKDLLGYDVEEVLGKKRTLDFTPKKEAKKWLKRFKEVNAKRMPFSGFEVPHLHKNGSPVIFEVSGIPFFNSDGNFKGYAGINKDITERKQMTEALKESQKFSTALMENSPNPKSVLNPDTSIKFVNPAFEKLTGYKLAEVVGMKAPYP